jgi:hypothetical protein
MCGNAIEHTLLSQAAHKGQGFGEIVWTSETHKEKTRHLAASSRICLANQIKDQP